jgi:hypothetical protein
VREGGCFSFGRGKSQASAVSTRIEWGYALEAYKAGHGSASHSHDDKNRDLSKRQMYPVVQQTALERFSCIRFPPRGSLSKRQNKRAAWLSSLPRSHL